MAYTKNSNVIPTLTVPHAMSSAFPRQLFLITRFPRIPCSWGVDLSLYLGDEPREEQSPQGPLFLSWGL